MKELAVDPRAKALIFDLDGTLVDSMPLHYEAWKEVCATKGHNFTEEEFYSLAGVPSDRIFEIINERHGTDFDPGKYSKIKEDTYLKKIDKLKPVELDQARLGRLSRMDAMQSQAMSAELQRRRETDLRRINEALQRIEDGEYGYCVTCGEPINPKRLEIEPMTSQCVRCASDAEKQR